MTFSEKMTPGWHVRNVEPRQQERIEAALQAEGIRLGVDPAIEQLMLDGRMLTFRNAQAGVTRHVNLRSWNRPVDAMEIGHAISSMQRDIEAVRMLGHDVVASNLLVDEMSARAFFHMGGTASSIRTAVLEDGRDDPLALSIVLRRDEGIEMTLAFQEAGHGPGSYMLSSFVIPGIASMRSVHGGYVIRPARKLSTQENEAIGRGQGLARVLGDDLFDVFPFAVSGIDASTGAIRALRRTERRLARIEPRHGTLDTSMGVDRYYSDIDEIERQVLNAIEIAPNGDAPDRGGVLMRQAAKRAFLDAMETGADPWGDVVRAVLANVPAPVTASDAVPAPARTDWRNVRVEHLDLEVRARNCVLSTRVRTAGELDAMTDSELIRIPNLGLKSLEDIRSAIARIQTSQS